MAPMPQATAVIGAQEPGAEFEARITNVVNLLVGNYNIIEHNACQGLWHGRLNHVFELVGVLWQPRPEPMVRKHKSAGMVSAPTQKRASKKWRHPRGSSRPGTQTSVKELTLVNL
jgi:hypothetical protein